MLLFSVLFYVIYLPYLFYITILFISISWFGITKKQTILDFSMWEWCLNKKIKSQIFFSLTPAIEKIDLPQKFLNIVIYIWPWNIKYWVYVIFSHSLPFQVPILKKKIIFSNITKMNPSLPSYTENNKLDNFFLL